MASGLQAAYQPVVSGHSQEMLARMMGVTRQRVNRILIEWQAGGDW